MKHRIGILFVFLVVIGFGLSAEACETCQPAPDPGEQMCSSGWANGFQSCWGGFGLACQPAGGECYDPNGRKREPLRDYSIGDSCPTCMTTEPDQGFMLRPPAEHPEEDSQRAARD